MKNFTKGMKWYDIIVCGIILLAVILDFIVGYYMHAFYFSMLLLYMAMFLDVCKDRQEWREIAYGYRGLVEPLREENKILELDNFVLTAKLKKESYLIVTKKDSEGNEQKGIWCLKCHQTSWNENDVEKKYCGNCHVFHKDIKTRAAAVRTTKKVATKKTVKKND